MTYGQVAYNEWREGIEGDHPAWWQLGTEEQVAWHKVAQAVIEEYDPHGQAWGDYD